MIKITENKNYIWIIPLISGIIAIIGILTPMVYYNHIADYYYGVLKIDIYWWIWCFISVSVSVDGYSDSESRFISDSAFVIPSIITTFIIISIAVNLLILANSTKTKKRDTEIFVKSSLISGLLLIGTMIIYMVVIDSVVYQGVDLFGTGITTAGGSIWNEFDIGFGIIAPFISGFLAIIGAGIFYYRKQEVKIVQVKPIIDNLKFCHSCGAKIRKSAAYCVYCGIAQ